MSSDDARIAAAIRVTAGAVRAPGRLRDELAAQRVRRTARRRIAGALAATAATALAAVLALSQAGDEPGAAAAPTIAEAAAVALRQPALPAPARDANAPSFLRASAGGVAFPDYRQGGLRWRADGLLRAHRGGRDIVVVSYTRGAGVRAGYAIVGGPALLQALSAAPVVRDGMRFAVQRAAGITIVSWRRGGRTCVLASREASAQALLRMAAWRPAPASRARY